MNTCPNLNINRMQYSNIKCEQIILKYLTKKKLIFASRRSDPFLIVFREKVSILFHEKLNCKVKNSNIRFLMQ